MTPKERMLKMARGEWVAEGKTMLMVTHDKALAERVARKIEIIEGYVTRDEYIGTGSWAGS